MCHIARQVWGHDLQPNTQNGDEFPVSILFYLLNSLSDSLPYQIDLFSRPARESKLLHCKPWSRPRTDHVVNQRRWLFLIRKQNVTLSHLRLCLNFSFPFLTSGSWHVSIPYSKASVFLLSMTLTDIAPVFQSFASLVFPALAVSQTTVPSLEENFSFTTTLFNLDQITISHQGVINSISRK